ncbi:structural maintenance of chromosomes flexible hinge domain-containing protein GMI1-like isoform X2 [Humulus lupulus]|uniref:structural maintenance of chromosomes flexible hinge domain-containing protein GMI1-like isoform X2 n=1 Tax=Humulus lupulus TaxID=3486 RepID=UPI002B40FFFA|nr:structural maintenance of chromosomes flexible hinge domain-containing protein GMI1-like isoform X2 [Humulus lupulus]
MILELKHIDQMKDSQKLNHVYTKRVSPSSDHGIHGIYVFPIGSKFPCLFREAGVYTFSFSLTDSSCKPFVKRVKVKASSEIGKWALLNDEQSQPFSVSVGSTLSPLSIACYDIYDNRAPFPSNPEVVVKLEADEDSIFHVEKFKSNLSTSNIFLKIEGLLIESNDLDKIRPGYKATLVISNSDGKFSISIPCHVTPGCLNHVKAQQTILADQLLPGCIVKELELEVDHHGRVDLSGLLKVTAGYGENVSLSVSSGNKVFFKQEFQIEKRELRIASKVPEILTAGSKLANIIFETVNCEGIVDDTIHDEEKIGLSHMLTIKADWLNLGESVRYTFKHGRCIVPAIPLSKIAGNYSFLAIHSRHSNLSLNIEVHVKPAIPNPKVEHDGKNFSTVIENNKKAQAYNY